MLRDVTRSCRSFTPSAQLGEGFQRGGTNVRGSLGSMLLTGALLRRVARKGKDTATGGMLEGLYVFFAWVREGSDFEPWLIEKELNYTLRPNFTFQSCIPACIDNATRYQDQPFTKTTNSLLLTLRCVTHTLTDDPHFRQRSHSLLPHYGYNHHFRCQVAIRLHGYNHYFLHLFQPYQD